MGNLLTAGNVLQFDTAGATSIITGTLKIREIQWIQDNDDIVNDDDLVFVLGGVTFTTKAIIEASAVGYQPITIWKMGPFNQGIHVDGMSITTIDHGVLYVVID